MSTVEASVLDRYKLPADTAPRRSELGQEEFLELMVAQLRNQDPFEPMENGDFLAQMAQFSTVSGIQEMQSAFTTLAESLYANQVLQASSLVGKSVEVTTSDAMLGETGELTGTLDTPNGASNVRVSIVDGAGALARQLPLSLEATSFVWDGTDVEGNRAPAGSYKVVAEATVDGEAIAVPVALSTLVKSVTVEDASAPPVLELDNGVNVSVADVRKIF